MKCHKTLELFATEPLSSNEKHDKVILDPCCGGRMMYANRNDPRVLFGDIRYETLVVRDRSHGKKNGKRTLHIPSHKRLRYEVRFFNGVVIRLLTTE